MLIKIISISTIGTGILLLIKGDIFRLLNSYIFQLKEKTGRDFFKRTLLILLLFLIVWVMFFLLLTALGLSDNMPFIAAAPFSVFIIIYSLLFTDPKSISMIINILAIPTAVFWCLYLIIISNYYFYYKKINRQ